MLLMLCYVKLRCFICLVDSCVPGDMVTITGIVKITSTEEREYTLPSDCCMCIIHRSICCTVEPLPTKTFIIQTPLFLL